MRDSILSIGGGLDLTLGGHPVDLSEGTRASAGPRRCRAESRRRATGCPPSRAAPYTAIMDRGDLSEVLNTFDFPNPDTPMGKPL